MGLCHVTTCKCNVYCGSGGFLINAAKYIKKTTGSQKNIRLFGQEDVWNTWAIANINMILHGLDASIEKGDTLKDPKFTEEDNSLAIKKFDYATANFPFSQENWWKNGEPKKNKKGKPETNKDGSPKLSYPGKEEFSDQYKRFDYGIPPYSNGDFAFLQHIVASINENGKAGVVCPQGVLFRGQPEKTEEEDGQNRKADDEYLIRRGFLQGPVNKDGEFVKSVNIIDAIVVLPGNLFYGTTIPGSILLLDKNKPEERKNKVLMVYAAREGWYKEESNMNTLMPQDMLRISTILESWGDIEIAKAWIDSQKTRLRELIDEELAFKLNEIEIDSIDDIEFAKNKIIEADEQILKRESEDKKPTKTMINNKVKGEDLLEKLIFEKEQKISDAQEQANKERLAIDEVETELLTVLADPELSKRYFSVVDMEELEENEFNLNIPRYVDTFEPEEEIDLKEAVSDFKSSLVIESSLDDLLKELMEVIQ